MDNETLINLWKKKCRKANNTPICLISVNAEGFPVVYTDHKSEVITQVFKHLANAPLLGESTSFNDREN